MRITAKQINALHVLIVNRLKLKIKELYYKIPENVYSKIQTVLFFSIIFFVTWKILFCQIIDADGWWHIQCGKNMVLGNVDFHNYYWSEVTENYSNHKFTWLGDVILFLVYDKFGCQGLNIFRGILVFFGCVFLFLASDRKPSFFKMFFMICMIIGCYQKFLIRNSMFCMLFFPMILYLLDSKKSVLACILLLIWSQIHGSYLIGIGVSVFYINKRMIAPFIITFIIISYLSPMTRGYYNFDRIKTIVKERSISSSMLWGVRTGPDESIEFKSPWTVNRHYINMSIFLSIAAIALIRLKNTRLLLMILAVMFFANGYIRLVGYASMVSVFGLFVAEKNKGLRNINWFIYYILFVFVSYYSFYNYEKIINNITKPGLGKTDFKYSSQVAKYALDKYPNENTFNSMTIGGFLLLNWYPWKKVYIDTYFAPHPESVFNDYIKYINNPYALKKVCSTAIIPVTEIYVIRNFIKSGWYPEIIDKAFVLFNSAQRKECKVLINKEDCGNMTATHKTRFKEVMRLFGVNFKF